MGENWGGVAGLSEKKGATANWQKKKKKDDQVIEYTAPVSR